MACSVSMPDPSPHPSTGADTPAAPSGSTPPPPRSFAALHHPGYRWLVGTYFLAMMADNVEHVISYWMVFQKFQSPALAGFAVVSHWLPFLLFSLPVGALTDRIDPRRMIQFGLALFALASGAWAWLFITDTLQIWHAMVLLVLHGCAGVFWQGATQVLLHDVLPREQLPSGVRLLATSRYLGLLVGPAVGGAIMLTAGPRWGLVWNMLFYLPGLLWLWRAPYGPRFRSAPTAPPRAVRGFKDIWQTLREVRSNRLVSSMILLAGLASFFVANSYQALMPAFANDLGHGDPGTTYSMLLAADAAGALLAGVLLESRGGIAATPGLAIGFAIAWCGALAGFAISHSYPLALVLLFVAGICELAFSSMAQSLVQLNAPAASRGRVIGLYNMSALGLRSFAGLTVGLGGSALGIHASLAGSAIVLMAVLVWLRWRVARP
ncbi:Transmembrane secretion effector [Burkholderiales bacterium 8X]|nr:Transmembrane secretion effector [Burkholderiales bacterium 8X]